MAIHPTIAYANWRFKEGDEKTWKRFVTARGNDGEGIVEYNIFPPLPHKEKLPIPSLIAVVPVELYREEFPNVKRVLKLLHKARAGKGLTEVIIWFNSLWTDHDFESDDPEAEKMSDAASMVYELWLDKLASSAFSPEFRIRTIRAWRYPGENFNNIRSDYMDVLIMETRFQHITPEQDPVVVWIDANTPFLDSEALDLAEVAARERRGWFIKTNLQLTSEEGPSDFSIGELSQSERVAMVYSIARRNLEWNLSPTDSRGYVEEPGMAMLLSTYRASGGVATTDPLLGESRTLLQRAGQALDLTATPLVWNENLARVGKSYRRFVWMAERYPAHVLAGSEEGDDYESFTTLVNRNTPPRTDAVTIGEVLEMVRRMVAAQYERTGTGLTRAQAKRMIKIIHRCGFAPGGHIFAA